MLNRAQVGKVVQVPDVFEVGREHIRAFAQAIGDHNPLYVDVDAARAAGHRDVLAPPTFLAVLGARFLEHAPLLDPALGLDPRRILHGAQVIEMHRPVYPGDRLRVAWSVESIEVKGHNEIVTTREDVTTEGSERIATLRSVFISRGTATT